MGIPLWVGGWVGKGPHMEQVVFKGRILSRSLGVVCLSRYYGL